MMAMPRGFRLLVVLLSAVPALRAAEVAGLLSSDSAHYREAFQEFQQAFGSTVPAVSLDASSAQAWPKGMKVAVTFGARAALAQLSTGTARVVCMAPVLPAPPPAPAARLQILPSPAVVAERLKKDVQPGLQSIMVFWVSADFDEYIAALDKAFKAQGVAAALQKLPAGDQLSARLGSLKAVPQAFWIPPDPALVNSVNVSALLQYASFNRVPFYSPTPQFVEMGAAAAVCTDAKELATLAARAARDFLAGRAPPAVLMPAKGDLYFNRASMKHVNLPLGAALEKKARTVY